MPRLRGWWIDDTEFMSDLLWDPDRWIVLRRDLARGRVLVMYAR